MSTSMSRRSDKRLAAAPPSSWQDLTYDILSKVLAQLDDRERVRDVILVCKRWSELSQQTHPEDCNLILDLETSTCATLLPWAAKRGPHTTFLAFDLEQGLPRTLVVQALGMAMAFPKLRKLALTFPPLGCDIHRGEGRATVKAGGADWDNVAPGFSLLRQVEDLALLDVHLVPPQWEGPYRSRECESCQWYGRGFDPGYSDEEDHCPKMFFKGMNLQKLAVSFVEHNYLPERPYYSQALGKAIEALTRLTHLSLTIQHTDLVYPDFHYDWLDQILEGIGDDDPEEDVDGIAGCIAKISSLRYLKLHSQHVLKIEPCWSNLSNLTALDISGKIEGSSHFSTLQSLRDLRIRGILFFTSVGSERLQLEIVPGTFTGLTKLAVTAECVHESDLEERLPPSALAKITGLIDLQFQLENQWMDAEDADFDRFLLLQGTSQLTALNLGGNYLNALPQALAALPCLEVLFLGNNPKICLTLDCLEVLQSLKRLREVTFDRAVWEAAVDGPLSSFQTVMPKLEVILL